MTQAKIQPFCERYTINIGCFDGTRLNPRNIAQRKTSFYLHNTLFRLIWMSRNVSFDKTSEGI